MKRHSDSTSGGFSLIELLVAMFILVLLVMMSSRLFTNATRAWEIGNRKAEINMIGRTVMDYLEREVDKAVFSLNADSRLPVPAVSGSKITYYILNDSTNGVNPDDGLVAEVKLELSGGILRRNNDEIIRNIDSLTFELDSVDPPSFVDINLSFRASDDRARGAATNNFSNSFSKRVYFPNYHRSRNDDY